MRWITLLALALLLAMGAASAAVGEAMVIEVETPAPPTDAAPLDSENDMTLEDPEAPEEDVVTVDRSHFPDKVFRACVAADLDRNGDGVLSERERKAMTIDVSGKGISSLEGIEFFPELRYLYFSDNVVSALDLSENAQLLEIDGSRNRLHRLDLGDNRMLRSVALKDNRLRILSVKGCKKLDHLDLSGNALTEIDLTRCESLKYLDVTDNMLNRLRLTKNRKLQELYCADNSLKQLNLKKNKRLAHVIATDNLLTSIDVSGCRKLQSLDVRDNALKKLNVSGKSRLAELYCDDNWISSLKVKGCGKLKTLTCENNRLSTLDASDCGSLASLACARNRIKSLNIMGCGKLNTLSCEDNRLTALDASDCRSLASLTCVRNRIKSLNVVGCRQLVTLLCEDNRLTALDVGACPMLESLECARNELATLNVGGCAALVTLHCQENRLRRLDVRGNAMLNALACWGNSIYVFDLAALPDGLRALAASDTLRVAEQDMVYWQAAAPLELSFPSAVTLMYGDAFVCGQENAFSNMKKVRTNVRGDYPMLSDADFANFRAVTTTGMGRNALYRSSSPIQDTLGRNAEAAAAMEAAGVRTVLNLSDDIYEMVKQPYYYGSYYSAQSVLAIPIVGYAPSPSRMEKYVDAMRYMIHNEGPYLTHCIFGQDRTGVFCALLECLMGATPDEVVADYMQTYYNFYGVAPGSALYNLIVNERIRDHLIEAFGTDILLGGADPAACAEALLLRYGMTVEEIALLRNRLSVSY